MTRLVMRALLVPIGIGLAAIAALITGLAGAIGWGYGASLASLARRHRRLDRHGRGGRRRPE